MYLNPSLRDDTKNGCVADYLNPNLMRTQYVHLNFFFWYFVFPL